MRTRAEMMTASGRVISLLNPAVGDIVWEDIAAGLAKINRFNGATSTPYSVAQHSIVVADHVGRDLALHGLLHDAHEAYLGDMTSPVKVALGKLNGQAMQTWRELTARMDEAIYTAAGLDWPVPDDIAALIKRADLAALASEIMDIRPTAAREELPHLPSPSPSLWGYRPMKWREARDAWLNAVNWNLRRRSAA